MAFLVCVGFSGYIVLRKLFSACLTT
ncbi:TPA: hypothetical protein RQK07_004498 [Vibrio vulnificus]|nr:hypothetical protein [Vibrio vulnificus]HAS6121683.1 hypothetical protein [Vibrio vulnificus]HAS6135839.1 hypothetical protein [Vibrio vulnificus]HAS8237050.1 hypothetical protein [Vibrio vulnificus]HAT8511691.1 hypothetical protein [Vibrio vulnificus]